jgi:F0F1-type ATP synthase delta subunit
MKARQYAEALYSAYRSNPNKTEDLVLRLVALLKERGHLSLLNAIVREYEKIERMRTTSDEAHVRVARPLDRETYAGQITTDLKTLVPGGTEPRTVVDETLVGGYSLEARGKRIDRTYKRALIELYSQLLTNT